MRKLTILFALLTLSVGLLAETQTVNYNDANGKQQTAATTTVVTNSSSQVTGGYGRANYLVYCYRHRCV